MHTLHKYKRASWDLILAFLIAIALLLLNIAVNFIHGLYEFLSPVSSIPVTTLVLNMLFFWLAVLLAIAFVRWRDASRKRIELDTVLSSISPDTLLVVQPDRTIAMCNDSVRRLFGYHPTDVIGKKTDMLYQDRRVNKSNRHEIYEALEREGFHVGIAKGRRKDGREIDLEIISGQLSGREGAVLVLRDISDRVRAEQERHELELRVQQRQKLESLGVLAGAIAHDFNNLLTVILGNAALAMDDTPAEAPARPSIAGVNMAARTAADLCRQLLAYSGRAKFLLEPLDISDVVQRMTRLLEVSISKKVALKFDLAKDLPSVEGDTSQINQVVMNLITNAADAIGDKPGVILIATGARDCDELALKQTYLDDALPPGRYVSLEVTDSGSGMTEETRQKLFDPFFTTKFGGRGLGLASVLGIVRAHRGAIKVDSDVGKGAKFTILFPAQNRPPTKSSVPDADSSWMGSGTILLVDDEAPVRRVAQEMLKRIGFDVPLASDGEEAIRLFGERPHDIDIVLLDIAMPRLGGSEVLAEIRKLKPDARVILCSGYSKDELCARLGDQQPSGYIEKPYEIQSLRRTLRSALAESQASPRHP